MIGQMESSSAVCMNEGCKASSSAAAWKKGWTLRSGDFAILCDKCGAAYEQFVFCEMYHSKDTGWRECTSCGKRLHCGCIASSSLLELLDTGGVHCLSCAKTSKIHSSSMLIQTQETREGCGTSAANSVGGHVDKMKRMQSGDCSENDQRQLLPSQNDDTTFPFNPMKVEEILPTSEDIGHKFLLSFNQPSRGSSKHLEAYRAKDFCKSSGLTNLSISLSNTSPITEVAVEERELSNTMSSLQPGSRSRNPLPRPPNSFLAAGESNSSIVPQLRVARPPVEGRVKNQLLPRYWPRITDQELQQISGDSNSTIVPLFEKVLSASDAGRIGRLVLPKACAEAYFPPISLPEGLPLRIQDVKGKEWVFQFRFWPNNNSRMYVLEGVTPCIQSMQLQAGDTVTFSRMDPEGKLLMGFRKASSMPDSHLSVASGAFRNEPLLVSAAKNLPGMSAYSGLLQSLKESRNSSLTALSEHFCAGNISLHLTENNGANTRDGPLAQPLLFPEQKRSRNIGSKSKRLILDIQDSLELKLSWEELQDMLRPPSHVKSSTLTIDGFEFEEFDEPPVFAKRSIFTIRLSGQQEQWTQCDSCSKWRRLPAEFLLPPKWTCQDNVWDPTRCSCSAPDELSPRELEDLLKMNKEFKRRRAMSSHKQESGDLDAPLSATGFGGESEPGSASVATTTKHPRHRPGCSCIVCIQPPSGKGKHKPNCTCNVCMTVKRRFKTLMMRKKKRQSEREAEIAQRNQLTWGSKEEAEVDSIPVQATKQLDVSDSGKRSGSELQLRRSNNQSQSNAEAQKTGLDLNYQPDRNDLHLGPPHVSMTSLVHEASLPLETYLRQNGLTSLVSEQQASSPHVPAQANGEGEVSQNEDRAFPAVAQEHEEETNEVSQPDDTEKGPS